MTDEMITQIDYWKKSCQMGTRQRYGHSCGGCFHYERCEQIYKQLDKTIEQKLTADDDKIEEIIETILEHCECEHDYEPATSSYPGHSDVSYSLEPGADGKVYAAIKTILKEGK